MKKLLTALVALLLIAAVATSALAVKMYVINDQAKVRKSNNKKAEVISRFRTLQPFLKI